MDLIKNIANEQSPFVSINGNPGSGKTFACVSRILSLLTHGVSVEDILVVTPNHNTKIAFCEAFDYLAQKERTANTGEQGMAQGMIAQGMAQGTKGGALNGEDVPAVLTIHQLCQSILNCSEAKAATGRIAQVMLPEEEKVLLEDMKVTGIKPQRLREMLKFFFKSFTEFATTDEKWLISDEERMIYKTLREHLLLRQAILSYEESYLAVSYLKSLPSMDEISKDYVLVDGFSSLNRASQTLVEMLAIKQLMITGVSSDIGISSEPYPDLESFLNFCDTHKCASYSLPDNNIPLTSELSGVLEFLTPQKEWSEVSHEIKKLLDRGYEPSDILVVAPNISWASAMCDVLQEHSIDAEAITPAHFFKGDPRNFEKSSNSRLLTALGLLAHPDNITLWRSWLGFGDWLLRSDAWAPLCSYAEQTEQSLIDMLKAFDGDDSPGAVFAAAKKVDMSALQKLFEPLRSGWALINNCSGLKGQELIDALLENIGGVKNASRAKSFISSLTLENDDAKTIYNRVWEDIFDPRPISADKVRVAIPSTCSGLNAKHVFLMGMVNGFLPRSETCDSLMPPEQREVLKEADRKVFKSLLGLAEESMNISYFRESNLEDATMLQMEIAKISARKSERIATIIPSDFISEYQNACEKLSIQEESR